MKNFLEKVIRFNICKECARKPKEEIETIEQEDGIIGFLKQSLKSQKNISRLKILSASKNNEISELVSIVLEIRQETP